MYVPRVDDCGGWVLYSQIPISIDGIRASTGNTDVQVANLDVALYQNLFRSRRIKEIAHDHTLPVSVYNFGVGLPCVQLRGYPTVCGRGSSIYVGILERHCYSYKYVYRSRKYNRCAA